MFTPDAEIIHLGGQSTAQKSAATIGRMRLSVLKFIKKSCWRPIYGMACLLTILFFAVRIPIYSLICLFVPEKREQSTVKICAYLTGIGKVVFPAQSINQKQSR